MSSVTRSGLSTPAPRVRTGLIRTGSPARPTAWGRPGLVALTLVVVVIMVWELVKLLVPADGVSIDGTRVIPRTDDGSLPHIWDVFAVLSEPEVAIPGSLTTGQTIGAAMWFSMQLAFIALLVGSALGLAAGALLYYVPFLRRALLPFIVLAPTVPVLAIAPLVAAWSGKIVVLGYGWQLWMSVVLISTYLVYFPVTVGMLRGLLSPTRAALELMHCFAASRWQTLLRVNLPSSVPFLIPALKLGAASSVVGVVVAEIATGTGGGIGRLILDYIPRSASDGSRLFAAVIAAALLGLVVTAIISLIDVLLAKYQGESS